MTHIIKYIFWILVLLPCSINGQQISYNNISASSSSMMPPSNAGGVSESILLTSFSTNQISIPVGINYYSSGTKVNERPSSLGIGWSLSAGGYIARTVRDIPDDFNNPIQLELSISDPTEADLTIIKEHAENPTLDSEPDLFSFNFSGISGSFVMNSLGEFVCMPYRQFQIEYEESNDSFIITTDKGSKYHFGTHTNSKETKISSEQNSVVGWYLTKIEDLYGQSIELSYTINQQSYYSGTTQTRTIPNDENQDCGSFDETSKENYVTDRIPLLASISSLGYGRIEFEYGGAIEGVKPLTELVVYEEDNTILKEIELGYVEEKKRFFLTSIEHQNAFGETELTHQMSYIDPHLLPEFLSFAQDHWGYYNGEDGNLSLLPKNDPLINGFEYTDQFGKGGADRSPNKDFAEMGMLKSITYPTGGSKTYTYASNSVMEEVLVTDGVAKNRSKELSDSANGQTHSFTSYYDQTIDFDVSMEMQGVGSTLQLIVTDKTGSNNIELLNKNLTKDQLGVYSASVQKGDAIEVYLRLTTPEETRDEFEKAKVSFDYSYLAFLPVEQEVLVGGVRIAQIESYDPTSGNSSNQFFYYGPRDNKNTTSGIRSEKINFLSYTTEFSTSQYCHFTSLNSNSSFLNRSSGNEGVRYKYITVSNGGQNYENGGIEIEYITEENSAPINVLGNIVQDAPWSNDALKAGKVKAKRVFRKEGHSDFVILSETINDYDIHADASVISAFVIRNPYAGVEGFEDVEKFDVTKYNYHSSFCFLKESITHTGDQDGANKIETKSNFAYTSPKHHYMTSASVEDSEGDLHVTNFVYPQDYSPGGPVIIEMVSKHLYAVPIESYRTQNGVVVGATASEFASYSVNGSSFIALKKVYRKENTGENYNPSSNGQSFNAPYQWISQVLQRDDRGRVLSSQSRNGLVSTDVFGYGGRYVVASVQNATYQEVKDALRVVEEKHIIRTEGSLDNASPVVENINLRLDGSLDEMQLADLRNALPNAFITGYTITPGVGVSSVEDTNGRKQFYTYDSFSRLKHVKDHDGHVLSSKDYYIKKD